MANSADLNQLASSEANWSGSTLFAKAGYIRVQQDKVKQLCDFLCAFQYTSPPQERGLLLLGKKAAKFGFVSLRDG